MPLTFKAPPPKMSAVETQGRFPDVVRECCSSVAHVGDDILISGLFCRKVPKFHVNRLAPLNVLLEQF